MRELAGSGIGEMSIEVESGKSCVILVELMFF